MQRAWPAALVLCLIASSAVAVIGCARRSVAVSSESAAVDEPAEQTTVSRYPAEADADTDVYRFPDDRGGKLMADLLVPSVKTPLALTEAPARPRQRPTSRALEEPTVPLPRPEVGPPRALAFKASPTARPRPVVEDPPLTDYRENPAPPGPPHLPAAVLVRLPSPDVNQPPSLPFLSQRQPEPPPQEDPTAEASLAAALAARPPARTGPAPFLRLTLPDPFEHRAVGKFLTPAPEERPSPEIVGPPPR